MSIAAQASVLTETECSDLLRNMALSLQQILQEPECQIPKITNRQTQQNGDISYPRKHMTNGEQPHDMSTSETQKSEQIQTNTEQLRQTISVLANISPYDVREDSSIFELGLDSIDVIKLSSRLRKNGIKLLVSDIIQSQTIARIARMMSVDSPTPQVSSRRKLEDMSQELTEYLRNEGNLPSHFQAVLPATPLQQSMVKEMIQSNYERYFIIELFKLNDGIDIKKLEDAVRKIIAASPILRTSFTEVHDPQTPFVYAQVIHSNSLQPSESIYINWIDGTMELDGILKRIKLQASNIAEEKKSLFQVYYFDFKNSKYMAFAISHALYDGRSLQLLHEDIYRAYQGTFSPRPNPIDYLGPIFESTTEDAQRFWKSILSDLPLGELPRKEVIHNTDAVYRTQKVSGVSILQIESLCKSLGVSIQTISQLCFVFVLSYLTKRLDVVFGSVFSCRDSEEVNEVMFPFMNTVTVRGVLSGTIADMLRFIQDQNYKARRFQHFPLGLAQSLALSGRRPQSAHNNALFDALFIYQGRQSSTDVEHLYQSIIGKSDVEFPLCVEMEISAKGNPIWTIACKPSVLSAEEGDQIIEMLDSVLLRIMSDPESQVFKSEDGGVSVCGLPRFILNTESAHKAEQPIESDKSVWSDEELKIRKALHALSGFEEVTISKDTSIYQLGLDSVLVLKLAALLKSYGIKLKVSEILQDLTISAMSRTLHQKSRKENDSVDIDATLTAAISRIGMSQDSITADKRLGEIQYLLPVTAGQKYMIRRWQASRGTMFYPTFSYTVSSDSIDKQRLESSWNDLRAKHDILRTGFFEEGSSLVQVIFKDPPNPVRYHGGTSNAHFNSPHDLTHPPVLLAVEESVGSVILKLTIHHALYDGISIESLIYQLQSLYRGEERLVSGTNFKSFIAHSLSIAEKVSDSTNHVNGSLEATVSQQKWRDYFAGLAKYQMISSSQSRGRTEVFRSSLKSPLFRDSAQRADVSVDALIIAAIAIIYARKLSSDHPGKNLSQIVLGIYLANRAPFGEDLSELVAPTFNLLPLLVRNPLGHTITECARNIQDDIQRISSAAMSAASLEQIYQWTGVRVDFFVNILKPSQLETGTANGSNEEHDNGVNKIYFKPLQSRNEFSQTVEDRPDVNIVPPMDGSCDAYLVSSSASNYFRVPTNILSIAITRY